jgi:nucleoside-diphosphate-sugar epimerase
MMQNRKTVLVTGGAGFIGSNLCASLIKDDVHVDCVDNLITGRVEAIQHLRSSHRFRLIRMDITDPAFLAMSMSTRYDEIYHLACPTGVPNIKTYGEQMLRTCSAGTEHVLQIARAHYAKLIYTSSAEVYGNPAIFPQSEEYCGNVNSVGPRSAYEEGKRYGEALTRLYSEKYCVDAKIVRIFNTFGVGMSPEDSRVIPRFLKRIRDRQPIIVYGDGRQTRTYLYIDDLIAALQIVMARGPSGEVYNIGGEQQHNIIDLIEIIRSLTPAPVKVKYRPHFIEDHSGRQPMTAKVKELGWQPRIDLATGLRRMLVSYGIPTHDADDRLPPPVHELPLSRAEDAEPAPAPAPR